MPDQNIETLRQETYLKTIENSVGSKIFNTLYVKFNDSGKIVDVLNDGEYSCAYFVSSILYLFNMIDKPHTTVATLKEIISKNKNWQKISIEDVKPGDVVFYEKIRFENGLGNAHVGFVINETEVVSNDSKKKIINNHLLHNRDIESIYRFY